MNLRDRHFESAGKAANVGQECDQSESDATTDAISANGVDQGREGGRVER